MSKPGRDAVPKKKCIACENDLDLDATGCSVCKSSQRTKLCDTCKKAMPEDAERCNECSTYQGGRRHLPFIAAFALFISSVYGLVSGGCSGFSYLMDRNSDTRFKVTSSSKSEIYLKAWNTGRKPSTLVEYRLRCDELPAKEVMLEISSLDKEAISNVIAPGIPAKLQLSLPIPTAIPERRLANQCTPEERRQMALSKSPLTLEIDVEESSDADGHVQRRRDRFPADRISEFLKEQGWSRYGE